MQCILMNKKREVAQITGEVSYNAEGINMPEIIAGEVKLLDKEFSPVCMAYPQKDLSVTDAFNKWFSKRLVSKKRKDIPKKTEMAATWISPPKAAHKIPHFFSFTDQYWIRYDKADDWEKLNFFNNDFSPVTGQVFMSLNQGSLTELKYVTNSPDITTTGIQPKRWRRERSASGDKVFLYKAQRNPSDASVFTEVMASKMLKKLNCIPFVTYEFGVSDYQLCSKSECFVTEDTELVPASHIYRSRPEEEGEDPFSHLIQAAQDFEIPGVIEYIDMMIEVDRMLLNFDRHLGNFGFLRNVNTGKFIGPAPLYDFGSALFITEENERLLKENQLSHYFKNRERKLIREGRIKGENTLDKQMLLDTADALPIDHLEEKIERADMDMKYSNNHIISLQMENERSKDHKPDKEHKKEKIHEDNMPSLANF